MSLGVELHKPRLQGRTDHRAPLWNESVSTYCRRQLRLRPSQLIKLACLENSHTWN